MRSIDLLYYQLFGLICFALGTFSLSTNHFEKTTCDISNMTPPKSSSLRAIRRILPQQRPHWVGDGFHVFPVFADLAFTDELSPFLMFDYAAPKTFSPSPSKPRGVGQHPHRGFETVTIAFQGEVEHQDSTGNQDVIGPGDTQWMTAGRGIIHEEYHSDKFSKDGGVFEMCQLWVNLPKKYKMTPPAYQPILNENVPLVTIGDNNNNNNNNNDAIARIIAGELHGVRGPATTFSPVQLWDINIFKKNSVIDLPFDEGHNCIVFVRRGGIEILQEGSSSQTVGPQAVALMEQNGTIVRVKAVKDDTSILILGGEPLNEPIAARGPFVMNTWEEIQQANMDFQSGQMGT
jgi:redox-sensitive bicupin YhaK (pirin superfamily)